jgi:phosphohistidine phosphatase
VPRTLLLIRHAKAEQGEVPDRQRGLTTRGEADATALGHWLVEHDLAPTYVVVSPARRASLTWKAVGARLDGQPHVTVDDRIYDNHVDALLGVVHDLPAAAMCVALVGHNPSMHELALELDDGYGDEEARAALAAGYPTASAGVFTIEADWPAVARAGGRLVRLVTARA